MRLSLAQSVVTYSVTLNQVVKLTMSVKVIMSPQTNQLLPPLKKVWKSWAQEVSKETETNKGVDANKAETRLSDSADGEDKDTEDYDTFPRCSDSNNVGIVGGGDKKGEKMQENWDVSCSGDSHDGGKDGYVEDYDPFQ